MTTGNITRAQVLKDLAGPQAAAAQDPSTGITAWAFGIARVVSVNEDDWEVTLRPMVGSTTDDPFSPIPLTMPGAGKRHVLGAIPEVGDTCFVGWRAQDSKSYRKVPVIITWLVPNGWLAGLWATGQAFSPEEVDMTPKLRAQLEGHFGRTRYKAPMPTPGNVFGSSSQGSDLLMNESVTLSNRRANELILRDQDQAIVTRSLQQFHHMAGVTVLAGMVQRDATFLPRQLFSDGHHWHPGIVGGAKPEEDTTAPDTDGYMTPAGVFYRGEGEDAAGSGIAFPPHLDPYEFLQKGLYIDSSGFLRYHGDTFSDAVPGGKGVFRVATQAGTNAAASNVLAFTEHRTEISHTADGTLPVAVQTDGIDADKLAGQQPYLEVVYGTVVGNDAYTEKGRETYGLPLRPVVGHTPTLASAVGHPIGDQTAMLVQLHPPAAASADARPTWWALQKDGRFKFSVAGVQGPSIEGSTTDDIKVGSGGQVTITAAHGFHVDAPEGDKTNNHGIDLTSQTGAVVLFGGGTSTSGAAAARHSPEGEFDLPSVHIEGKRHVHIVAGGTLVLGGGNIVLDSSNVTFKSLGSMGFSTGDAMNLPPPPQVL